MRIALAARRRLRLDTLYLVPTFLSPHKPNRDVATPRHRLRMLELSTRGRAGLKVCDLELRRRGPSYTVDTLRRLRRRHPGAEWFIVVGADNARSLSSWRRADLLAQWATFAVVDRPGAPWKPSGSGRMRVRVPRSPLSSTEIRRRARRGLPFSNMVPPGISDYIIRHRLYGGGKP